ncbi:MAG TPA: hypothetical protein PLZ54_00580 [Paludibacteraceae bacterium]|nr:hypothetical protein [Paludibacteraceae bacterium]HOL29081.1 hypothetical protein [Paludibacteraceae bacterium]HON03195.1 hypothetical protein [Paludibacteraceae bacterium]HPD60117.1 hypothetical protein [Paludibacteraceae bacterium]HPL76080.1 hypothetical protein [Paludibacteraceae bacterium]
MGKNTLTEFNQAAKTLIERGLEKLPVHNGMVNRGMDYKAKRI